MNFSWEFWMFASTALGSVFGVFYPTFIKLFKDNQPVAVSTTSPVGKILIFLGAGIVLGVIVAAIGFAALLGSNENQKSLQDAGTVAFFLAFAAGFASGSLFEEPLK